MRKILSLPARPMASESTASEARPISILSPQPTAGTSAKAPRPVYNRHQTALASVDVASDPATGEGLAERVETLWASRALLCSDGRFVAIQQTMKTGQIRVGFIASGTRNVVWRAPSVLEQRSGASAWLSGFRRSQR